MAVFFGGAWVDEHLVSDLLTLLLALLGYFAKDLKKYTAALIRCCLETAEKTVAGYGFGIVFNLSIGWLYSPARVGIVLLALPV